MFMQHTRIRNCPALLGHRERTMYILNKSERGRKLFHFHYHMCTFLRQILALTWQGFTPLTRSRVPDEKWVIRSVKTNLSHANESWQNPVGYFQISICKWNDKRDLWNVKQIEKSRSKFTIRLAVAHQASQHTRATGLSLKFWLSRFLTFNLKRIKVCHRERVGWPAPGTLDSRCCCLQYFVKCPKQNSNINIF